MNFNELIKEQQERNREKFYPIVQVQPEDRDKYRVVQPILQNALDAWYKDASLNLDQLTQQTAEAVRDWMVEEGRKAQE